MVRQFNNKPAEPLDVFVGRTKARATLVRSGDLDLHEALDQLRAAAVQAGLVDALGQDLIEGVMAEAFARVPAVPAVRETTGLDEFGGHAQEETVVVRSTFDQFEDYVRRGDAAGLRRFLATLSAAERIGIRRFWEAKRCRRSAWRK